VEKKNLWTFRVGWSVAWSVCGGRNAKAPVHGRFLYRITNKLIESLAISLTYFIGPPAIPFQTLASSPVTVVTMSLTCWWSSVQYPRPVSGSLHPSTDLPVGLPAEVDLPVVAADIHGPQATVTNFLENKPFHLFTGF
jgi:hypothetical protein